MYTKPWLPIATSSFTLHCLLTPAKINCVKSTVQTWKKHKPVVLQGFLSLLVILFECWLFCSNSSFNYIFSFHWACSCGVCIIVFLTFFSSSITMHWEIMCDQLLIIMWVSIFTFTTSSILLLWLFSLETILYFTSVPQFQGVLQIKISVMHNDHRKYKLLLFSIMSTFTLIL